MAITPLKEKLIGSALYGEFVGLSSDDKPTDRANGSSFLEMDTGDKYYYDAESETWINPLAESGDA